MCPVFAREILLSSLEENFVRTVLRELETETGAAGLNKYNRGFLRLFMFHHYIRFRR